MEFEVVKDNFAKALSIVNKAISAKASLPILSNVLISEDNKRLKITATDLDRSIITWVGAKITDEASTTIPAKPLLGFVSSLNDEKIKGTIVKDTLKLETKTTKASFNGVSSKDFPTLDYKLSDNYFEIPTGVLKRAVEETYFSASADDSKPAWTGILFNVVDGSLHIVALDGYRMSKKEVTIDAGIKNFNNNFTKVIVPAKNLLEVVRLASNQDTIKVDVQDKKSVVLFYMEDVLFVSKMLDGEFPEYNAAIPTNTVVEFEISSEKLSNALKLASVFAQEQNAIRLSIKVSDNLITVLSDNVELGANTLDIPVDSLKGEDLDIAFNAKYILDYLTNVPSETLIIKCSGQSSPAIFIPKGREDYIHVAVPLNPYW